MYSDNSDRLSTWNIISKVGLTWLLFNNIKEYNWHFIRRCLWRHPHCRLILPIFWHSLCIWLRILLIKSCLQGCVIQTWPITLAFFRLYRMLTLIYASLVADDTYCSVGWRSWQEKVLSFHCSRNHFHISIMQRKPNASLAAD